MGIISRYWIQILEFGSLFVFFLGFFHFMRKMFGDKKVGNLRCCITSVTLSFVAVLITNSMPVLVSGVFLYAAMVLTSMYYWRGHFNIITFLCDAISVCMCTLRGIFIFICTLCVKEDVGAQSFIFHVFNIITLVLLTLQLMVAIKKVDRCVINKIEVHRNQRAAMNIWMGLCNTYYVIQGFYFTGQYKYEEIVHIDHVIVLLLLFGASWAFIFYNTRIIDMSSKEKIWIDLAQKDDLTKVYNKNSGKSAIEECWQTGGVLCVVDVDNFKNINDTYGHFMGDVALKSLVERIERNIASDDIVVRYGGDEFLIFMKGIYQQNYVKTKLNRLLKYEVKTQAQGDPGFFVTVSMGCVLVKQNENRSFEELFKMADSALYQSKEKGRQNYTILCS